MMMNMNMNHLDWEQLKISIQLLSMMYASREDIVKTIRCARLVTASEDAAARLVYDMLRGLFVIVLTNNNVYRLRSILNVTSTPALPVGDGAHDSKYQIVLDCGSTPPLDSIVACPIKNITPSIVKYVMCERVHHMWTLDINPPARKDILDIWSRV
jgi:hypothetical protein